MLRRLNTAKERYLGGSYGADVVPVDCARNCSGQEPGISAVASRLGRPPVGPHAGRCPQLEHTPITAYIQRPPDTRALRDRGIGPSGFSSFLAAARPLNVCPYSPPNLPECFEGLLIDQHQVDLFERSFALQVLNRLCEHDFGTFFHRETSNACADSGKGNRLQVLLRCQAKRMSGRTTQRLSRRSPSELHASRVNHVSCLEPSGASDGRATDRDAPNGVAFLLNDLSSLAENCASHTTAVLKIVVRCVHDGVGIHLCQIALHQDNFAADLHRDLLDCGPAP